LPIVAASTTDTLAWLVAHGIRPVAARVDAPATYTDVDLRGPLAIVLGSEAQGLGEAWTDPRVEPVAIPMRGIADSLNVSIAAAVLLYEARRQRGEKDS
jgi:TrmH family RNA methyltransferase